MTLRERLCRISGNFQENSGRYLRIDDVVLYGIRLAGKEVSLGTQHWWLCGRGWGEICSEVRRKHIEIKGRDIPVVVEIAAAETSMNLPVVARQDVEVQRVDRSIMIGVGGQKDRKSVV